MTAKEIMDERTETLGAALLKITTVPESFQALQARALYEIAIQLAQLNEGLDYLTSNGPLRVQVEPGQYPIEVNTHEGR